jgi:hypothetical protein
VFNEIADTTVCRLHLCANVLTAGVRDCVEQAARRQPTLPDEDETLLFMRGATNARFMHGRDCLGIESDLKNVPGQHLLEEMVDQYVSGISGLAKLTPQLLRPLPTPAQSFDPPGSSRILSPLPPHIVPPQVPIVPNAPNAPVSPSPHGL